ncbi:MAG: dioxygenase [Clostridia bacterium]|nr:dioxygenase [Clostridia bacterium]
MNTSENKSAMQIVYFSHGGGPMPILNDPSHYRMNVFMKNLPSLIKRPDAIVVISAHWEESNVAVQTGASPSMLYDYYRFPEEAYQINYPAKGSPELTKEILEIFKAENIPCTADDERGFDHGLFIPLMMMYPDADIPCFQVSLLHNLYETEHIRLGKALSKLKDKNILLIGSGFSFHNLMEFRLNDKNQDIRNDAFQDWLIEVCTGDMPQNIREDKLINWETAPNARYCHPRSEHLLPLHVCAAATGRKGELVFDDYIAGKRSVAFLWR